MGDSNITHLNDGDNAEEEKEEFLPLKDSPFLLESEDEYIVSLVAKESSFQNRGSGVSQANQSFWRGARSYSARWLLRMKDCFGFGHRTTYLAMSYFDRFSVHRVITDGRGIWAMKLLSVTCLSLAVKMDELFLPALINYQFDDYRFDNILIQRMELLVLTMLEWRMCSVTPFAYLNYFASKFECTGGRKDLLRKATGFIFSIIEAVNLVDCRPSTMAAAAILAASSDRLTKTLVESKMTLIPLPLQINPEHVYSCYTLMIQVSSKEKRIPPKISEVSAHDETKSPDTDNNKRRRSQSPPRIQ